jgi:molecular chaperone HscA
MENAKEDVEQRRLREARVDADRSLEALDSAMASDADELLSESEKQLLLNARVELVAAKNSDNADTVKNAIKQLEKAAEFYVARRMDSNIQQAMSGHNITEFES